MSQQVVKKLSATKQKLSLGEVKKTEKANATNTRKVIRTTVVNNDLEWPYISEEDEKRLADSLSTDLQVLKLPNFHVPLDIIKKVEKGDRRKYRHIYHTQRALEVGFDVATYTKLRMDLSIGANCVSKAIEQNLLKAVVIEKNIEPAILTKLLVPLAESKGVPIIAISGLNETCQNVFKTRCIALGFKASCAHFTHPFYKSVSLISSVAEKECKANEEAALTISCPNPDATAIFSETPASSDEEEKANLKRSSKTTKSFIPPKIRKV